MASLKKQRIARIVSSSPGGKLDPRYAGFFECFNRQLFFEAHEVLEDLWLAERGGKDDRFFKGLIQLAGAFVHVQKGRRDPAIALFKLARANIESYPLTYYSLELRQVSGLAESWIARLRSGSDAALSIEPKDWPRLDLIPG